MSLLGKRLIVGLGNPGKEYEYTRHNLGFLVVCALAEKYGIEFKRSLALKGLFASGRAENREVFLLLPLTYMNHSGLSVKEAVKRKNIALYDSLVVCDDVNLSWGSLRLRNQGSSGGHNGLNSVIAHLKTTEFPRLRLGVGRPAQKEDMVDYVLSGFNKEEKGKLNAFIDDAVEGIVVWLKKEPKKETGEPHE